MYSFEIDTEALTKLGEDIEESAKIDPENMEWLLTRIGVFFVGEVKQNFLQARDPYGNAWAPFTREPSQKRGGSSAKLLMDTGRLVGSITHSLEIMTNSSKVTVGTPVTYADFHQSGTPRNVARPFFPTLGKLPAPWEKHVLSSIELLFNKIYNNNKTS